MEADNRVQQLILNNSSSNPSVRIRRYMLRLTPFNFIIVHRPGLGNMAEHLSRHADEKPPEPEEDFVNLILPGLVSISLSRETIAKATSADETLVLLIRSISEGALLKDRCLHPFKIVFDELCVSSDEIILREERKLIPETVRMKCIDVAHEGNLEMVKTKRLLRSKVWFLGIDQMVEAKINSCLACKANSRTKPKAPVIFSEEPAHAWQTMALDFLSPIENVLQNYRAVRNLTIGLVFRRANASRLPTGLSPETKALTRSR